MKINNSVHPDVSWMLSIKFALCSILHRILQKKKGKSIWPGRQFSFCTNTNLLICAFCSIIFTHNQIVNYLCNQIALIFNAIIVSFYIADNTKLLFANFLIIKSEFKQQMSGIHLALLSTYSSWWWCLYSFLCLFCYRTVHFLYIRLRTCLINQHFTIKENIALNCKLFAPNKCTVPTQQFHNKFMKN